MDNPPAIIDLKPVLYDLLVAATEGSKDEDPTVITQKMGLALTDKIKRDGGVNVIQIQNVKIESIVPKIVEAMKMVDALAAHPAYQIVDETPAVEAIDYEPDTVEEFCDLMWEKRMPLRDVLDLVKVRYIDHILPHFESKMSKATEFLGVTSSVYYHAKKNIEKEADSIE